MTSWAALWVLALFGGCETDPSADGCVTLCQLEREDCYAVCDDDTCLAECDEAEDACSSGCAVVEE